MSAPFEPQHELRLLSFDGGGVRGLSSLLILRRIMYTVEATDDLHALPKPCDYFDMICGTSTGGLIAIMLGRLRMGIQECIDAYCDLAQSVFQEKAGLTHSTFVGKLLGKSRFSKTKMEKILQEMIQRKTGSADTLMLDSNPRACRVFVCATRSANTEPSLLRSYRSPDEEGGDFAIWQAARATSAAPLFFSPIKLGQPAAEYIDGGLTHNNPIRLLLHEARSIWGSQANFACVISIGTGHPPTQKLGRMGHQILRACIAKATETEATASSFKSEQRHLLIKEKKYHRFNVAQGLQNVRLEEWEEMDLIDASTKTYMKDVETELQLCAEGIRTITPTNGSHRGLSANDQQKPRYINISGCTSPFFTGRGDVLSRLRSHFSSQHRRNPQVAVLAGLGGMGKTQVALQYAEMCREEYLGVFLIDATNDQELEAAFARIARTIIAEEMSRHPDSNYDEVSNTLGFAGLVNSPSRNPLIENYHSIVEAVKRFLARLSSKFLLIFDGADGLDERTNKGVNSFMPYSASLGDVIITTRNKDTYSYGTLFPIEGISEKEAIHLLYQCADRHESKKDPLSDAKTIVDELGSLPLALELAGAYLSSSSMSFKQFKRVYSAHAKDILSAAPRISYGKSIFGTWEISFTHLVETCPNAASLLQTISFMYTSDISAVFSAPSDEDLAPVAREDSDHTQISQQLEGALSAEAGKWMIGEDQFFISQAFAALVKCAMIKRIPHEDTYSIHPVVHLWARERLSGEALIKHLRDATMIVARALHKLEELEKSAAWKQQRRLLSHVRSCWQHIRRNYAEENLPFDRPTATATNTFAQAFLAQGYYTEADEVLRFILAQERRHNVLTPRDFYSTMSKLAYLCDNRGVLDEAQRLYEEVLQGRSKLLGDEDASTLETVNDLAGVYEYGGQLEKAEQYYKRALKGREKVLDMHDPSLLQTVADFAGLCDHQGRVSEARELHQRALAGREKALGRDHPDTLSSVLEVGGLYWSVGELEKAEEMYARACEGRTKFFGPQHPVTLFALNAQAGLLGSLGRLYRSETIFREVLEARKIALGENHPDTLWTHNGLGGLLVNKGKLKEAEELLEQASKGLTAALGRAHADTLWVFHNLAIVYENVGKLEEAEALHKEAFEGYKAELGIGHPDTLWLLNDLAACYERMEKLHEAEAGFQQAYDGKLARLGFFHPETLYTANCLAGALWAIDRNDEAEELYLKVLAGTRKVMGSLHPDTCACLDGLGGLYMSIGKLDEAETILKECYDARAKTLGGDHKETQMTRNQMRELEVRRITRQPNTQTTEQKVTRPLPSTYGFGSRRRRDERRWA